MYRTPSILTKHYPIIVYLLISLIIFLMVIWYLDDKNRLLQNDVIENAEFNTEMLANVSSNLLESLDLVLLSTSEKINSEREIDHLSPSVERFILRKLIVYPQIRKLTILNNDGSLFWKSYSSDYDEPLYRDTISRQIYNSLVFSILTMDITDQNQILICRASNLSDDETSKFVIGEIDLSSVFEKVNSRKVLQSARITLLDENLNIKLQSDFQEKSMDFSQLLSQARSSLFSGDTTDIFGGFKTLMLKNQLICFYQLSAFPYFITTDINLNYELKDWRSTRRITLLTLNLAFLVLLALFIYIDVYRQRTVNNRLAFLEHMRKSNERYLNTAREKEDLARSLADDILQREKSERALKESEKKFRVLFELSSVGMVLIDGETNELLEVNDAALKPTGYSREEFLSLRLTDLIPEGYVPLLREKYLELKDSDQYGACELEILNRKGGPFPIRTSGFQFSGMDGQKVIWAIIEDLTQYKKAEREKALLQEQLNHKGKMDALGQISGGIAHDINNILTGIVGATYLLKDEMKDPSEDLQNYINIIEKSSFRATDITSKLLLFSRKSKMIKKYIEAGRILDDTIEILNSTISKKIRIILENSCENGVIHGDLSALQSSLLNLGINASHAMPEGGEIRFSLREREIDEKACEESVFDITPGAYAEISVSDTGHGIAPENLSKIFDPFFTTKEPGKGTGLGLSVTLGTVIDHRGAVTVESQVDRGTTFRLFLPLVSASTPPGRDGDPVRGGTGTILFVDDEEANRLLGEKILRSLGYSVHLAENGRELIEIYKKNRDGIDLVISDMMMPEMTGSEAFLELRELDPECKFIIASGYNRDNCIPDLIQSGLAGFIQKPYRVSEMSKKIGEIL